VLDVGDELEHPRVELLGALAAERVAALGPQFCLHVRQQGAGTVVRLARTMSAAAAADHHEGGDV
jgi:hypothetical protein